jgi:tetratricopeptide (TPR) repeat protein
MPRRAAAVVIAVSCVTASELRAQCADGSPPPCQVTRAATRESPKAPDPNRIAILPFRVTTTDTLLGEGFAELLATEFTGEGAPRAVDMATVLSAWRRAGGGLRTPLPREKAMQVARQVGAGLVSEGSIVGLGRNITVAASLFSSVDGSARGSPSRVTTSADSLESALRQSATRLLGAIGGTRTVEGTRYTDSPEAMRMYLHGLAAWRRGRLEIARESFNKAIAADSSFAQAVFRRYLIAVWQNASAAFAPLAWARRERLAPQERIVLEGLLGAEFPKPRTLSQRHIDRERAANLLPDSPDALYLVGDYWYHYGATRDAVRQLERARDFLIRASALDSQATVLRHLVEVGIRLRDTALLRKVVPAYVRTEDSGTWGAAWLAAGTVGDQAMLAQLRQKTPDSRPESIWPAASAVVAIVPGAILDEMFARWLPAAGARTANLTFIHGTVLAMRGRPAAAERAWSTLEPGASRNADRFRLSLALNDAALGLDVDGSARRLAAATAGDTGVATLDQCLVALWRHRQGDTVALSRFSDRASPCAWNLEVSRLARAGRNAEREDLLRADSALREPTAVTSRPSDPYMLAKAWEASGDLPRALTAIRYRLPGFGQMEMPWNYPEEGRLAALVGDTLGAVRAYRFYLEITADAEPILAPKRDSIKAELVRLTRRVVP